MKKTLLLVMTIVLISILAFSLIACANNSTPDDKEDGIKQPSSDDKDEEIVQPPIDPSKLNFTNITFSDLEVTYDALPHILDEAVGVPDFATATYTNRNEYVDAGTYQATVTISAEGYNDLVLKANLTINKAELTGVTFEDAEFNYDGNSHGISISGMLPSSAKVVYSSDVQGITNFATEIGTYNIQATITDKNFKTLVLNAVLKISVDDKQRLLAVSGDTLFFDNAKDKDYFYAYNFNDGEILKIESAVIKDIDATSNENVVYVSGASLFSSIKTATYDNSGEKPAVSHSSLYNKDAEYIQYQDAETFYYAVNGLTNSKSGIYKIDFSGEEPVVTLLSIGKAKYLKLYDNTLYFADGANDGKLSKINTTDENQTRTLVLDKKINNLYENAGVLYFTVNETLGNYIANYNIVSGVSRKLTIDAAGDMVVVGDYLYYINVDLFTTSVIGNGIYKVNKNPITDINSVGTKVVEDPGEGLTSLTAYGNNLIYYDVDGYKLMKYNISTGLSSDILQDFTAPEDPTPITMGSQCVSVNNVVYYLDIWDGKTLHMYNPQTGSNFRITADKVKEFSIIGDYIYMNVVTFGVNNNTYRVNYKTGDVPELINPCDSVNIVSDGTYIYYIKNNASGAATEIHRALLDGTEDTMIYEYGVSYMSYYNGALYFIGQTSGGSYNYILKIDNVATLNAPVTRSTSLRINDDARANYMYLYNGVIYFNNTKGTNSLSRINVDGTNLVKIVDDGSVDIGQILVDDNYVYYFNRKNLSNDYDAYRVSKNAVAGTPEKITTGMHPWGGCICGDKLYFVDYYSAAIGDSHLYSVSVEGGTPTLIA